MKSATMAALRNLHRSTFTEIQESKEPGQDGEVSTRRMRVKKSDYISFKKWLRTSKLVKKLVQDATSVSPKVRKILSK